MGKRDRSFQRERLQSPSLMAARILLDRGGCGEDLALNLIVGGRGCELGVSDGKKVV